MFSVPKGLDRRGDVGYHMQVYTFIHLAVYALTGQHIRTLVDGERSAGSYSVTWDGTDDAGRDVASGVYLCRMTAGAYSAVRKLLLVR